MPASRRALRFPPAAISEVRGALANLDLNLLPDEAIDRIANGENVMSVLASMVPRAGEALPGLLKAPSEPAE